MDARKICQQAAPLRACGRVRALRAGGSSCSMAFLRVTTGRLVRHMIRSNAKLRSLDFFLFWGFMGARARSWKISRLKIPPPNHSTRAHARSWGKTQFWFLIPYLRAHTRGHGQESKIGFFRASRARAYGGRFQNGNTIERAALHGRV